MEYLPLAFLAGILSILAPCVLPVLPVVLGSSLENAHDKARPIIVTASLGISIIIFTLILKASTLLISIPPSVWNYISGGIILLFGIFTLFPELWGKIELGLNLSNISGSWLQKSGEKRGLIGSILVGAALGPVFASCSPTYFLILAVILPTNFLIGVLNLGVYALGLSFALALIAILGQRFLVKIKWAVDPKGKFKMFLGVIFVLLGLAIITGFEKKLEAKLLDLGFADITKVEEYFLKKMD